MSDAAIDPEAADQPRAVRACDLKCCACKDAAAVAFWPCIDPDIPSHPYCRACLDKVQMELLIELYDKPPITGPPVAPSSKPAGADKSKARRCPRCGELPGFYTEMWRDSTIEFDAREDGAPEDDGTLNHAGQPYCVFATCRSCKHKWRLRGVLQITDLGNQQ